MEAPEVGGAPPVELLAAVEAGRITADRDLRALPLLDAHVVEAVAIALDVVTPPPAKLRCRNCGAPLELPRGPGFPLQPLLDAERPHDEELDHHAAPGAEHALPSPIAVGRARTARTFRLLPRALADRPRLVALLGDPCAETLPPLSTGPSLVRAIGLQLGEVKSPLAIARALEALDDDRFAEAWGAIARAWDETHYTPRLLSPTPCPKCGARHDVEVPPRIVLDVDPPAGSAHARAAAGEADEPFPTLDAFRARAAAIAREELEKAGFDGAAPESGLEIVVDDDVPPCDDGGEPLLGSYTPRLDGERDAPTRAPFEIALYYRTFASMHEEEPYDVDAEIRETIAHELEHHQGFLAGHDPLDDEERAEIAREHRRVHGHDAAAELRAGARWLARDLLGFWRTTWPLWLIAAIAIGVMIAAER
jgi:hypothetical protein